MEKQDLLILDKPNVKSAVEEIKDGQNPNASNQSNKYDVNFQEKLELKRFGHTFTLPTGIIPSPRAAHASIAKEELILYTFGGAVRNGALADNDIHFLEFSKGLLKPEWGAIKLPKGNKPPKRYGHGLLYSKPNLIVFGGTCENNHSLNDLWVINIDEFEGERLEWSEVYISEKVPSPRTYFSSCICKGGKAKGMILIFGGRGENREMLNDLWGLRKHRNGDWEWIQAAYKSEYKPIKRFQHSMISFTSKLVILGGRDKTENLKNAEMPIDVFDFEKMLWSSIYNMNVFRHSSSILDRYAFIYGGCHYGSPMEGSDKILVFDVSYLISQINLKLKSHILTNYQDISKTVDKPAEKSDEEKDDKNLVHKSTSRSKTEKNINTLSLEPEVRNQPRKSLPTIKIAVKEHQTKLNNKKQKNSKIKGIKKVEEDEDFVTPIILQKADIASVNTNVVNNYILNTFMATASENIQNLNSNNNAQTNMNLLNNLPENLGIANSPLNSKVIYQTHFPNSLYNGSLQNPDPNLLINFQNINNGNNNITKNTLTPQSNLNYTNISGFLVPLIKASAEKHTLTSSCIKTISLLESNKFKTIEASEETEDLYEIFIKSLLRPSEWKATYLASLHKNGIPKFRFRREHIIALTKACNEIILSQKMVLHIKTPVKVFGDIHGQYEDLMRFFELWGEPSEYPGTGDINATDYLFLGDYVDRGVNSLETICLLMALKIKYPEKIHLLRGNHEDRLINSNFGFLEECEFRLPDTRDSDELNVFEVVNEFFDCLPLAAIIDDEILCIHGGLGGCLTKVSEIEEIKRPLRVVHEANNKTEQIVMDILWSDPTENDSEFGIQPNIMRDSRNYGNIVKFGPDIVDKFLKANGLSMIIRAHECVLDGFERFDGGKLITLFSATDYCKRHKNAGAMLIINNNFEIIPHLIYPLVESGNGIGNQFVSGGSNQNITANVNNNFANRFVNGNNTYENFALAANVVLNANDFTDKAEIGQFIIKDGNNGVAVYANSAMNSFGNISGNINNLSNGDNSNSHYFRDDIGNENISINNFGVNCVNSDDNIVKIRHLKWIDEADNFEKRPPTPLRNRDFVYNNVDKLLDYEDD